MTTDQLSNIGIRYIEADEQKVYFAINKQENHLVVTGVVAKNDDEALESAGDIGEVIYLSRVTDFLNSIAVAMAMTEMEGAAREELEWEDIVARTVGQCQKCGQTVSADQAYYGTPCGTFCDLCIEPHFSECGDCARVMEDRVNVPTNEVL